MHEAILRDFFLSKVDAKVLSEDIKGSRVMTSQPGAVPEVSQNHIVDMDSDLSFLALILLLSVMPSWPGA
jgi:hypothetical protein